MSTFRKMTCCDLGYLAPLSVEWRAFAAGWAWSVTFLALMALAG